MPALSVVLPMLNEAPVVSEMLGAVVAQVEPLGRDFEIVCVDDGSTDDTGARLDAAAAADPRVVPVHFSRNFGKEAALTAGLQAARGDAVILLDADLQHPPELIPTLVARWDEGFDVVDAVKRDRGEEGVLYGLAARAFHALMGEAVGSRLSGSSDFKLLDRQVVEAVLACPERGRFFRGLVAWVGFRVARVPFDVAPRPAGTSRWSTTGLITYSLRNIAAFSSLPLRLVAWAGFVTVLLDAVLGVQTLWNWWRGAAVSGFTTVILATGILCGLILVSLGVIALYLARVYDEQKARPLFIVRRARHAGSRGESPTGA